jgi:hypothetical protein
MQYRYRYCQPRSSECCGMYIVHMVSLIFCVLVRTHDVFHDIVDTMMKCITICFAIMCLCIGRSSDGYQGTKNESRYVSRYDMFVSMFVY